MAHLFAYLNLQNSKLVFSMPLNEVKVTEINSVEQLIASPDNYAGFILNLSEQASQQDVILKIRQSYPLAILISTKPSSLTWFDLICQSSTLNIQDQLILTNLLTRYEQIKSIAKKGIFYDLLKYLYIRMNNALTLSYNWRFFTDLGYNIQQVFNLDKNFFSFFIQELRELDIVQQGNFKDILLLCSKCESSHLKFNEICPTCSSHYLVESKFIHCFSCGSTNPEYDCLNYNSLICSSCNSKLMILDKDYDYSLGKLLCKSCTSVISESETQVQCINCLKTSTITQLSKHYVFEYIYNQRHEQTLLNLIKDEVGMTPGRSSYTLTPLFQSLLEWQLQLHERYADDFALLILDCAELVNTVSMKQLGKLFLQAIRKTDLLTITRSNKIIVLLQKAKPAASDNIATRVNNLLQSVITEQNNCPQPQILYPQQLANINLQDLFA